ncbi:hypothetical protein IGI04_003445 [Brassica rapa subsp. trilocularis]|uniref:BnaAnng40030D protein n=3 Tax=Brassica TaxID=3705 RepID=A0A078K0D3_BRANA|nr:hypothetical protein IGI04_003445 [Brassica rapa subsp. trilocularis]CDY72140.1 BnaAnng40030D [Brassica napus]
MEEAKGPVKHVLLAKFKDDVTQEKIDELIKDKVKTKLNEGKDVSIENLHQGFTHIFESTFDSKEAVAEYVAHPLHVEFANMFLGSLDKVLVIDYKPTSV